MRSPGEAPVPNSTMFKLEIDSDCSTVEFLEVPLMNEVRPEPRVSHSMVSLNGENILMMGGIGVAGQAKNQMMRDLWLFNTE